VVRQSFGRFRGCYEDGLRSNPSLEGRVTARFVIGRDGAVSAVRSGGTDLPDERVVSCILRTYTTLSFPAPKDGIVTVSYPLLFSPAA
jgi:outer membrane biosynthesis protein TonB